MFCIKFFGKSYKSSIETSKLAPSPETLSLSKGYEISTDSEILTSEPLCNYNLTRHAFLPDDWYHDDAHIRCEPVIRKNLPIAKAIKELKLAEHNRFSEDRILVEMQIFKDGILQKTSPTLSAENAVEFLEKHHKEEHLIENLSKKSP